MKYPPAISVLRCLAAAAALVGLGLAGDLHAAFVYESPTEFFSAGDFNGDGIADVLVLDKLTGNARVGYSDGAGNLYWSAPLVTGVENATGLGVHHFLSAINDSVAVTAPEFNRINLVDLSQTNAAGTPKTFAPTGVGPHALAGLTSPLTPSAGALPYLFVASSRNDGSGEWLDLMQWNGLPNYLGQFNETGPFDRLNALDLDTNTATLAVGMVRGATNDELDIWQFTNSPAVMLVFSNLPSGSDYTFGNFNGETLPRFIFYQPGASNLSVVPLLETNGGYAFGPPIEQTLSEAVKNVFTLNLGANGSAIIQFGDGIEGLTLPGGSPALSAKYQTGAEAAGNVFTGIVPLANGAFALLDTTSGAASSTHAQVIKFDGTSFPTRTVREPFTGLYCVPEFARLGGRLGWIAGRHPCVHRDRRRGDQRAGHFDHQQSGHAAGGICVCYRQSIQSVDFSFLLYRAPSSGSGSSNDFSSARCLWQSAGHFLHGPAGCRHHLLSRGPGRFLASVLKPVFHHQ